MNKEQTLHAASCLDLFNEEAALKYSMGQKEHGGNMWEKPGMLRNAYMECIDFMFYTSVIGQQVDAAKEALENGDMMTCWEILEGLTSKQKS